MFEHFMPRRGKKRSKQSRGARPSGRNHWLPAGRSPSPVIELLEMCALLSAVSVTDLSDDGTSSSLRAAFNAATGGETITLSAGTYALTQGELNIGTISGTLTIVGQTTSSGAPATIIDQLSLDRVIQIAAGASVTLRTSKSPAAPPSTTTLEEPTGRGRRHPVRRSHRRKPDSRFPMPEPSPSPMCW